MTPIATVSAMMRLAIRRRLHPLARIGYNATKNSSNTSQTYLGLSLIGLGWYLKSSKKRSLLYAVNVHRGKVVKVKVMRGATLLAETTVAN